MKKKYKYIYLTIAALIIGFAAYRFSSNTEEKVSSPKTQADGAPIQVNAVIAVPSDFSNIVSVSGTVEPNEQVQLRSEVPGIIRNLTFKEGSFVQKDQVLFTIDDTELQAQLLQRLSEENLANDNANRAALLLEKEAISTQERDVAQADLHTAKALTQLVQAQIAKTKIRAPFSGKIGLRSVSAGEYLTPTTVVANLLSINPIKILFAVPEKYSSQIKLNQTIYFTVSGSQTKHEGKIYAIEPGIDPNTRTIQIRATADNASGNLFPGSFARVEVPINLIKDAVLIPTEAVIPIQNGKQVFLYKDGRAKAVEITTENRTSSSVLVHEGIQIGDTVLTSGIMSLKDNMAVQVNLGSN